MITATDLFCGAGGSSWGAEQVADVRIDMAANHWSTAVEVHQSHFPHARHDLADISQADPRRYPRTNLLIASPECFPAGVLILCERGLVPVEEVQVGDRVLTHRSRWRSVTATMSSLSDTLVIRGQGLAELECTPGHPLYVRAQTFTGHDGVKAAWEPEWVPAEKLCSPPVGRPGWQPRWRWATPTEIPALPVPAVPDRAMPLDDPEFWWLIGRWLGDGTVRLRPGVQGGEVTIVAGDHEVESLGERLARWSPPEHVRRAGAGEIRWRRRRVRTAWLFETGHQSLAEWLVEHFGRLAHGKTVPTWALGLPADHRRALLDGYLSADGHIGQRRTSAASTSKRLALGMRLLAESLGHRTSLARYPQHADVIEGRPVAVRDQWHIAYETNRSQRAAFAEGDKAWSLVREVMPGRDLVEVFNLSVDEDESYVADGIIVHNCTNHSQAKGVSRKQQDVTLFDTPDPAAERSRATMWDVGRFAEQKHYDAIIVENVVEATKWTGWAHWLGWLTDLGYQHRVLSHNSMHHGVPQSRDRIYVVFWRRGLRPDLELEVTGFCAWCEQWRPSRQAWKPNRTVGRYGQQWFWACTNCGRETAAVTEPAAKIIDWSLDCPRIGDRARPLAEKTRARILAGLQRYGWAPVVTAGAGHVWEGTPGMRARALTDPLPVQHTSATTALATPPGFLLQTAHEGRIVDLGRPHPTVTAQDDRHSLIVAMRGTNGDQITSSCQPSSDPLRTVSAGGIHHGLLMRNNEGGAEMVTPLTEPARTMTTKGHQSLLVPYYRTGTARLAKEPMPTVTSKDVCALVYVEALIDDCGFRMLEPHEIAAAMAFPDGYIPQHLSKKDQVRLAGNAVTPPAMTWIVGRVARALEEAR